VSEFNQFRRWVEGASWNKVRGDTKVLQKQGVNAATGANIPGMDFGVERTASIHRRFRGRNEKLAEHRASRLNEESTLKPSVRCKMRECAFVSSRETGRTRAKVIAEN